MWPFDKIASKLCTLFDKIAQCTEKPDPAPVIPPRPSYIQDVPRDVICNMVQHVGTDERHDPWRAASMNFFSLQDQILRIDQNMNPVRKYDDVRSLMIAIGHQLTNANGDTHDVDLRDFTALYRIFRDETFPTPEQFPAKPRMRLVTERNQDPPILNNRQRAENFRLFRDKLCEAYETVLLPMQMRSERLNRAHTHDFWPR